MPDEGRLPTALWLEAQLRKLNAEGGAYYILQKGNYAGGIVMLKINGLGAGFRLFLQQRDFETDRLVWIHALGKEDVDEKQIDAYIQRAIDRDPDLWVVEIENADLDNPFEGHSV